MRSAKLFWNGRSQAVRLPKELRFEGDEVSIRREGERVILEPLRRVAGPRATGRAGAACRRTSKLPRGCRPRSRPSTSRSLDPPPRHEHVRLGDQAAPRRSGETARALARRRLRHDHHTRRAVVRGLQQPAGGDAPQRGRVPGTHLRPGFRQRGDRGLRRKPAAILSGRARPSASGTWRPPRSADRARWSS